MPDDSVTLARVEMLRDKGKAVAAFLRADPRAFQEQAALSVGITRKTYYAWLNGEDEASLAFQAEVLPAIFELAAKAEEKAEQDIASSEGGSGAWANWHKWKLSQRFRKQFGDLAQKVELTGANGGPVRIDAAIAQLSDAELAKKLAETE